MKQKPEPRDDDDFEPDSMESSDPPADDRTADPSDPGTAPLGGESSEEGDRRGPGGVEGTS